MAISFFIQAIEDSQQAKIFSFQHTENKKISRIQLHSQKLTLHESNDIRNEIVTYRDIFSLYNLESGLFWRFIYPSDPKDTFCLNTHLTTYGYSLNQEGIFRPYEREKGLRKKFLYISDEKITTFVIDSQGLFLMDALECYDSFEEGFNHFMRSVNNNLQNAQNWFEGDKDCQYIDFTNVLLEEIIPLSEKERLCSAIRRDTRIPPDIVKIRRRKNKWYVFLERAYEKQALVVLNDDYQAINALGEGAKKTA
ncbi:MAG: hypothetical protein DRR00_32785 [Candidatus Parabeggiatoa sp. nov. 3]|nr:MAG: hypothetical protein DRR00_32785 [Gammaproteobacteria bacterium]